VTDGVYFLFAVRTAQWDVIRKAGLLVQNYTQNIYESGKLLYYIFIFIPVKCNARLNLNTSYLKM